MAGPGGGGHSGGFGGGGGFHGGGGGGFGGGGFHGAPPPRGPRFHFGFWGMPFGFGGCLGPFMGFFFAPFVLLLIAVIMFFSFFGAGFLSLAQGGIITYDEEKFQDYTDEQYYTAFGGRGTTGAEDNILLVFLTNEDTDYYYAIAWVGDHVARNVNNLFGNDETVYGRTVVNRIGASIYKYSFSSALCDIVETMQTEVETLSNTSNLTCNENGAQVSRIYVKTQDVSVNETEINAALTSFDEATGITISIVVENMETVFGKYLSPFAVAFIVILVVIAVVLVIVGIVKFLKNRKKKNGDGGGSDGGSEFRDGGGNYRDPNGDYYDPNSTYYRSDGGNRDDPFRGF